MTSKVHRYLFWPILKSTLAVWVLLIGWALPGFSAGQKSADSPAGAKDLFARGNAAYAKGKFEEAVAAYKQLLTHGHQSAAVYYNLGNSYYRLDEMPQAILYYEKAYKRSPSDEDIQVNLRFANQKITDRIEAVPEFFLVKWWKGLAMALSLQVWSVMASVLFFLGFLFLIFYLFSTVPVVKKGTFYAGLVLLLTAVFSLVVSSWQHSYLNNNQYAIVFNGTVDVQSAPEGQQKTLFVIHEGTKVKIAQREGNWVRVVLPNGNIGWMEARALQEI